MPRYYFDHHDGTIEHRDTLPSRTCSCRLQFRELPQLLHLGTQFIHFPSKLRDDAGVIRRADWCAG